MRINRWIGPIMLAASLATVASASPAFASKPTNCVVTSSASYPGITTTMTVPAEDAGTVKLKRDAINDGLIVRRVLPTAGWSKSVEIGSGPNVEVQFSNAKVKKVLEAFQSAQYYGPNVLVVQVKTCS